MHRLNRAAFLNVDGTSPFLRLYARLVALELALKDLDSKNRKHKHDVVSMVLNRNDATLTALAIALQTALGILRCTDKDGNSTAVRSALYPDLRYLRHDRDFPGETSDASISSAVQALDDLLTELSRQGVKP